MGFCPRRFLSPEFKAGRIGDTGNSVFRGKGAPQQPDGANLVTDMNTIPSISSSEPIAPIAPAVAPGTSQAASRAGASAVQPVGKSARQGSSDARDILRQSEAIEELRASVTANARTRLQIERDEESEGRFIYKLMDPETGETLRRWPPEKFGDLVNFLRGQNSGVVNERV